MHLAMLEVTIMFLRIYQEDILGVVGRAEKGCLNHVLAVVRRHGKSPCFSTSCVLRLADVDQGILLFGYADGGVFHE